MSFDIDVLDPASTRTGTPEPEADAEVFPIRALCTENNLVGFELVEFNPVDPLQHIINANRVVQECYWDRDAQKRYHRWCLPEPLR